MTGKQPVVLVTPTIMSGTVVRWYFSVDGALTHAQVLSASREGVLLAGNVFLHDVPDEWIAAAKRAHEALKADRRDEVRALATHRRTRLMGGDIEPVGQQA